MGCELVLDAFPVVEPTSRLESISGLALLAAGHKKHLAIIDYILFKFKFKYARSSYIIPHLRYEFSHIDKSKKTTFVYTHLPLGYARRS